MSETTNLKLFKHDNPSTNENQFDVTEALNENWDKIDEFAEKANDTVIEIQDDVEELQGDNTTNKQDIANLKTENEELKAENERLNQDLNALPSNTAEGEYITLNDSADSRFNKFKILGKSTQATRSGKNKFNINMVSISTATDKVFTTSSFVVTDKWSQVLIYNENLIKMLEPNKNYKMIADVTLLEKTSDVSSGYNNANLLTLYDGTNTITVLKTSTTTEKNNWTINEKKHLITEFTTPADLTGYGMRCYCYYTNNAGAGKFKYDNVMILEATEEDETFEQYGVSPSPEFSSKTRNVGDNINLFDGELEQGNINGITGVNETNIDRIRSKNYIEIPVNTDKIRVIRSVANNEFWLRFYDANKSYLGFLANDTSYNNVKILDFNMDKNAKYIRFVDLSNDLNNKIKITTDLNSFEYSPYKCGNIETDICNNNLTNTDIIASLENSAITINSKNSFSVDLSKGYITPLQDKDLFLGKNDKNKRYKLSYHLNQNNNSFRPYLVFRYSDGTSTIPPNNGSQTEMDVTLTSTEGKTIEQISFGWGTQTGGGVATFSDIYLRLADDTSEFKEQEKQEFVFPLSEGQVLHEEDYLADDGIHNKRITIIFDGTESSWAVNTNATNEGYSHFRYNNYPNLNVESSSTALLCSHFKRNPISAENYINDASASNILYIGIDNNIIGVTDSDDNSTKLTKWKNWLANQYENGTPVTIETRLKEETITPYTDEQKKSHDKIEKEAKTYKTVTNIFSTNEVSPKFEIEYRQDIKALINNVSQAVLNNA